METGLFIIDAIIIAIVILPFALFINGRAKRKKQLRKAIETEAAQHNCKLTKLEMYNNFALGVDTDAQKLFFYKATTDVVFAKVVDLKSVAVCKIIKETKRVKNKSKHYDVIDKLQLSLINHNRDDVTYLEFYNNDDEVTLSDELSVAQKWQDYLNELLASKGRVLSSQNEDRIAIAMN